MLTCDNNNCKEGKWKDGFCTDEHVLACYHRIRPAAKFYKPNTPGTVEQAKGRLSRRETFDYKNGEDYICALCGETKHTAGPLPDKLCDPCWELKTRIESSPDLARKVIRDLEIKELSRTH